LYPKYFYKKKQRRPPSKKNKRGKNLSPRNGKACHRLHAKRHGDRNPKYHEEQEKDVARILATYLPKNNVPIIQNDDFEEDRYHSFSPPFRIAVAIL
jgi:hypothetical protein